MGLQDIKEVAQLALVADAPLRSHSADNARRTDGTESREGPERQEVAGAQDSRDERGAGSRLRSMLLRMLVRLAGRGGVGRATMCEVLEPLWVGILLRRIGGKPSNAADATSLVDLVALLLIERETYLVSLRRADIPSLLSRVIIRFPGHTPLALALVRLAFFSARNAAEPDSERLSHKPANLASILCYEPAPDLTSKPVFPEALHAALLLLRAGLHRELAPPAAVQGAELAPPAAVRGGFHDGASDKVAAAASEAEENSLRGATLRLPLVCGPPVNLPAESLAESAEGGAGGQGGSLANANCAAAQVSHSRTAFLAVVARLLR